MPGVCVALLETPVVREAVTNVGGSLTPCMSDVLLPSTSGVVARCVPPVRSVICLGCPRRRVHSNHAPIKQAIPTTLELAMRMMSTVIDIPPSLGIVMEGVAADGVVEADTAFSATGVDPLDSVTVTFENDLTVLPMNANPVVSEILKLNCSMLLMRRCTSLDGTVMRVVTNMDDVASNLRSAPGTVTDTIVTIDDGGS